MTLLYPPHSDWVMETGRLWILIKIKHYYLNHKLGFRFLLVLLTMPGVQYIFFIQITLNAEIFLYWRYKRNHCLIFVGYFPALSQAPRTDPDTKQTLIKSYLNDWLENLDCSQWLWTASKNTECHTLRH